MSSTDNTKCPHGHPTRLVAREDISDGWVEPADIPYQPGPPQKIPGKENQ